MTDQEIKDKLMELHPAMNPAWVDRTPFGWEMLYYMAKKLGMLPEGNHE